MASYGVAEAKNNFTHLLDRVQGGESITITRHGKPVAELRAAPQMTAEERKARLLEIANRRLKYPPLPMTSVELINGMYDEPAG
ncbi:hypothetical protein BH10PSE1_BH10PSE1_02820 [soil metagenome]